MHSKGDKLEKESRLMHSKCENLVASRARGQTCRHMQARPIPNPS